MKTLFTYLPFAFFLLTMWTFVLPLTRRPRAQALSAMALLVCFSKFLCFGAFGGDAFAPELPAAIIRIWCVLYSSATILFGLTMLWWTACFLLRLVRVRLPLRSLLVLPFAAVALAVWGVWNGLRAPDVREVKLAYEDLPEGLDGYRIVQISDLHASASAREDRTAEIVARANALAPDLVCLTGDYADGRPSTWRRLLPLKDLRAKDGVWAVTGNHEYYNDWVGWRDRLTGEVGLRFLENDCAFPRKDLAVGGVNDYAVERFGGGRFPWVGTAFAAATNGEFRILLQHQPRQADANCEAWDVRLQLSGHTHGGVMPLMDRLVAKANNGFVRGAYRLGRSWLYVSPGCGQWAGFPVRYFNPTEVTLIRLVRRPAAVVAACRASGADAETECRRRFTADATKPGATLGNVAKMVNVWNARACGLSTATNRQDYDIFEFVEWIELMQCMGGNAKRDLFRDPSDRSTKDDYELQSST